MQQEFYTLAEIADLIGAELQGDPDCKIFSVASLAKAKPGQISFLVSTRYQLVASARYEKILTTTQASAVILSPSQADQCPTYKLLVDDPYQGYIKVASLFIRKPRPDVGIHPTAIIGSDCSIGADVTVGPHCVIGDHCVIGEGSVIEANTVIKDQTRIGTGCYIHANVTIYQEVIIGNEVIIYAGAIIGSEGFGMVRDASGWQKIPHLGTVIIGDRVEIGANTTIDRGALDDTVLANGVKLDNLIQLGHGVNVGENTVIAGCVGVAGSTHIGKNCMIGGLTGLSDNITVCDNVIFTGMSQVTKSITKPGVYSSGTSIFPQKDWHKNIARLHNLDDLARKLRKMEREQNE